MEARARERAQATHRAKATATILKKAVMKATSRAQASPRAKARAQRASLVVMLRKRKLVMELAWNLERAKELMDSEKDLARKASRDQMVIESCSRSGVYSEADAEVAARVLR